MKIKLFSGMCTMRRDDVTGTRVEGFCATATATSEDEAVGLLVAAACKMFPSQQGWSCSCPVMKEISDEMALRVASEMYADLLKKRGEQSA